MSLIFIDERLRELEQHERLEILKGMHDKVDFEDAKRRLKFLRQIEPLIGNWSSQLPDLREVFSVEELELLLSDAVQFEMIEEFDPADVGKIFVEFVIRTGFKATPRHELCEYTPLHMSSRRVREDWDWMVHELFKIYDRFDWNYPNPIYPSHYHVACMAGLVDVVKKFIEHGDESARVVAEQGGSPLCITLDHGKNKMEMVKLLLTNGADPNVVDADGSTPLHVICRRKREENLVLHYFDLCAELGLEVWIQPRDNSGDTPLHLALKCADERAAGALLSFKADPNAINDEGMTPLHCICDLKHDFLMDWFLSTAELHSINKVDIDVEDNYGRTPLQWSVAYLKPRAVKALLKHGADLSKFVFPTSSYFATKIHLGLDCGMRLAANAMLTLEHLKQSGYELSLAELKMVIKLFKKHGLYEKSGTHLKKCLVEDRLLADTTQLLELLPNLTLFDLILMRPNQAAKRLTIEDYHRFAWENQFYDQVPGKYLKACAAHVCEKLSRVFFLRCAEYFLWELTLKKMPIHCCEMIIDNNGLASIQEMWNVCLAADHENKPSKKRKNSLTKSIHLQTASAAQVERGGHPRTNKRFSPGKTSEWKIISDCFSSFLTRDNLKTSANESGYKSDHLLPRSIRTQTHRRIRAQAAEQTSCLSNALPRFLSDIEKVSDAVKMVKKEPSEVSFDECGVGIMNEPTDHKNVQVLPFRDNLRFPSERYLETHILSKHSGIKFTCDTCGKEYSSKSEIKSHINALHNKILHACNICGKKFMHKTTIRMHIDSVHKGIKHKCDTCGKIYTNKPNLHAHITQAHKNKKTSHGCGICGKTFTHRASLKLHISSRHEGVKHKCGTCGSTFTTKPSLQKHIDALHNGIGPKSNENEK
ncbi:unnamed protein product [Trichogramma brassicae]|uniref:C2H2-type domain-containing protein n=1 Tax=Trichogramma brassicae TaxID=86971 RepID=A0A6H5I486_9HYME|nr:unnamed protein product [Trichogramma brassicae]